MKFAILVDEKPKTCNECIFYQETLKESDMKYDGHVCAEICTKCSFDCTGSDGDYEFTHDNCPLTEATIFNFTGGKDE